MSQVATAPKVLYGDQQHGGLRVAVVVIMLVATLLGFPLVLNALRRLPEGGIRDFAFVLSCTGALVLGVAAAALGEYWLKRTWRSGRSLLIGGHLLEVREADQDPVRLDLSQRFVLTTWQFTMTNFPRAGRERQIQKGWLCLACQLQQESHRIVAFTFLAPQRAGSLFEVRPFHELHLGQIYPRRAFSDRLVAPGRPIIPSHMLADARHGPFWLAEQRRWTEGMELTPADFELLLNTVHRFSESS